VGPSRQRLKEKRKGEGGSGLTREAGWAAWAEKSRGAFFCFFLFSFFSNFFSNHFQLYFNSNLFKFF
jgi:hypothetical protein